MIIAVDIETYDNDKPVLDATKFTIGSIARESGAIEIFTNKTEMWQRILKLGYSEANRNKVLSVYAHYHQYDFYGYADLSDPNLRVISEGGGLPFIATYTVDGKTIIRFLDTWALYRMPLKDLGKAIGLPKLDMPDSVSDKDSPPLSGVSLQTIEKYVGRDSLIALQAVQNLKKKLSEDGIRLKRLITIDQVSIAYVLNLIRRMADPAGFWYDEAKLMVNHPKNASLIHEAYRGGVVEHLYYVSDYLV